MASVAKLSVRGVRSFSPDDNEQVVEFYTPLTVIVGANGCGKTTIIESLKFAVTGSLPPGNKSGQAFVHDPRSAGQSVVKANIKLRFTNTAGNSMVVVRSMEVTQKKTSMQFKQLDGVLRTMNEETGERVSLSHKCSELDRQIPTMLGVSKAILEHVVFCHQEESSWPLMEGAVLKKRFDDIFDSSRYTKALEVIRKMKTDYNSQVKDLKAEVAGLSSHKHAVKGFRQEQSKHVEQLEEVEEEIKQCKQDLGHVINESDRIKESLQEVQKRKYELDDLRSDLVRRQSVVEKQLSMLEEDMTETKNEMDLKDMLRDFDRKMSAQVEEKEDVEAQCRGLEKELQGLVADEKTCNAQIAKLNAEKESYEKMLRDRLAKMQNISQSYQVQLSSSQVTATQNTSVYLTSTQRTTTDDEDAAASQETLISVSEDDLMSFQRSLQAKERSLKEDQTRLRERAQAEEDQIQAMLTDLIGKQKTIENERAKLKEEEYSAKQEVQTLSSQVAPVQHRMRKQEVEEAKRLAAKAAKERDDLNKDARKNEIPAEIRNAQDKIDKLRRDIEEDEDALRHLRDALETHNSIDLLKDQCEKDTELLQESLREQKYSLDKIKVAIPAKQDADDLVEFLDGVMGEARSKHDAAQDKLSNSVKDQDRLQQLVSEAAALRNHNLRNLESVKAKLANLSREEGKVAEVSQMVQELHKREAAAGRNTLVDHTQPQELSRYLDERLADTEMELSELSQPRVIKRIIKTLIGMTMPPSETGKPRTGKPKCPCCRRKMGGEEAKLFLATMNDFKDVNKSELIAADKMALKEHEANKSKYLEWRSMVLDSMNDLLDYNRYQAESAKLETTIRDLDETLKEHNGKLEEMKTLVSDLRNQVDELRLLRDSASRWFDDANRIAEKQASIKQKQEDLDGSAIDAGSRDLKTVERDLRQKQEEKDNLSNKIIKLNKELSGINSKISAVTTKATRADESVRLKQEKFDREQEATVRKATLNERIAEIGKQYQELQNQVFPLQKKIKEKEADKNRSRQLARDEEATLSSTALKFNSDVQAFRELSKQIEEYPISDKAEELNRATAKVSDITKSIQTRKDELESTEPHLQNLTKAVNDQERHKKVLKENLDLIHSRKEIDKLKYEIGKLEDELEDVAGDEDYTKTFSDLSTKRQKLEQSRARLEGRRMEIAEHIRAIKRKLVTPEYKGIDERHRVAMIKHETTKTAVADLDTYYTALDKSLLKFHSMKISEINTIIKELWNLTYKGEDITSIELVSGHDAGSRASRSYNYRVVMTKGATQLDMRGRCSAGQRVLASIVIRLALAETFCVSCGCIALDEPTVNLDYNNKRGLAIALAQIIASRSQQRNFQLILITHDEDFVAMMKTELSTQTGFDMPEKYFQVRREEGVGGRFYSKIDAINWDDLV